MNKFPLLLFAVFALFACSKINNRTDIGIPLRDIEFDVTISFPNDPNEIKTNWEVGDAVFLIIAYHSDFYIKMTYDGSDWNTTLCGDGALSATIDNEKRTVTAIHMPLGSNDTPSFQPFNHVIRDIKDLVWKFPTTYFTSYMDCRQAPYTLHQEGTKWVFSATLDMKNEIPSFWVEDSESASGGDYFLYSNNFRPQGFSGVYYDGSVYHTGEWEIPDGEKRMRGYKYKGGWLFSGRTSSRFDSFGSYFILTDLMGENRHDYSVLGDLYNIQPFTKFPPIGNSEWVAVGENKYVELKTEDNVSLGTWSTCNVGATVPEEIGAYLDFSVAIMRGAPSENEIRDLFSKCTLAWVTVNDHPGVLVKAASGFLFLPHNQAYNVYWTSTKDESYINEDIGYAYNFENDIVDHVHWQLTGGNISELYLVRTVKN